MMIHPLAPLSLIYEVATNVRNKFYESGLFGSEKLSAKVISVGNITVGGTGKTPLVAFVAKKIAAKGEKVCILTRGYGRENSNERVLVSDSQKILADVKKSGDEPFELAEKLIGIAAVLADKNRFEAGKWAIENLGITAFVLDDGFQHRQLKRDLDIVCIDATKPFASDKVLPLGELRESLANLKRADAIVITRANLIKSRESRVESRESNLEMLFSEIRSFSNCPIFISRNRTSLDSRLSTLHSLAFCGLGNPENFFSQLKQDGFNLVATKTFRDHYAYTQTDVDEIEKLAKEKNAEVLLTTAKDAVKLQNLKFNLPLEIIKSELIFDDESAFVDFLTSRTF
ncbi:MAG: tetraacyldisaccharide 4'-kinase [Pyrinomonadaceae bacterium]|nr:tetraacyldisaccharide 4'-kinase [Pyrinomonadaceae bacterium]